MASSGKSCIGQRSSELPCRPGDRSGPMVRFRGLFLVNWHESLERRNLIALVCIYTPPVRFSRHVSFLCYRSNCPASRSWRCFLLAARYRRVVRVVAVARQGEFSFWSFSQCRPLRTGRATFDTRISKRFFCEGPIRSCAALHGMAGWQSCRSSGLSSETFSSARLTWFPLRFSLFHMVYFYIPADSPHIPDLGDTPATLCDCRTSLPVVCFIEFLRGMRFLGRANVA